MFRLQVKSHFDAGHYLRGYPGKCSRSHGHSFAYELVIEGNKLDNLGMLVDFAEVKRVMKQEIEEVLDHQLINELEDFKNENPTAENLAEWIFWRTKKCFPGLCRVTVWESSDCCVKYDGE